jgi:hypothetical protein
MRMICVAEVSVPDGGKPYLGPRSSIDLVTTRIFTASPLFVATWRHDLCPWA